MLRLFEVEIIRDIKSCEEKIMRIIYKRLVVFRLLYGDYNNILIRIFFFLGYYVI